MTSTGPGHDASLIYAVGRVNQGIRRRLRKVLTQWNLSVQEFTTLSVLDSRPGLSNAQLARRAMVTPQAMIEMLSKLESRGLVRRETDPSHGRILRADLTPAATKLLRVAAPAVRTIQDEILDGVSEQDREAVMRAMNIAMANLSSH